MELSGLGREPAAVSQPYPVQFLASKPNGRVAANWANRPSDERYLNLEDLHLATRKRADFARVRTLKSSVICVESDGYSDHLALRLPGEERQIAATNWSFGQLCSLANAPSSYLRQLPAPLAAINLQHGLVSHGAEYIKTLEVGGDNLELRAVTGADYGRIWDHELVASVREIAGNGVTDSRWKVPGVLDWSTMTHNPFVKVTQETTTLYASDRDVFIFLVDDLHPIEAGRLATGEPDLYFRGFYAWNSEVGSKSLGIASFYLRAVCQNRLLWGVEQFQEIKVRHSKFASRRFSHEVSPALTAFANSSPAPFLAGIKSARETRVAKTDEDRQDFLRGRGFSKLESAKIIETVLREEGHQPESLYDFAQGITALARSRLHQDVRLALEGKARDLMKANR